MTGAQLKALMKAKKVPCGLLARALNIADKTMSAWRRKEGPLPQHVEYAILFCLDHWNGDPSGPWLVARRALESPLDT